MPVDTREVALGTGEHVVHFYGADAELAATAGRYLTAAARAGELVVVIATEAHRQAFEEHLAAAGVDMAELRRSGRMVCLDAADTLSQFFGGGQVDPEAFRSVVGGVVQGAVETGLPVRAYGEMVGLLWEAGHVMAALEVETLWNDLALDLPFSLLCAYQVPSPPGPEGDADLDRVCRLHSGVISAPAHGAGDGGLRSTRQARRFPAESDAPRAARRFVTDTLRRWGHGDDLVDRSALVLTELATNAVVHGRSSFEVTVLADGGAVRIAVHDSSPVLPMPRHATPLAEAGRGLSLVAALTARWGAEATADGKVVWVALGP